jgi:LacI family transcriptional regulator
MSQSLLSSNHSDVTFYMTTDTFTQQALLDGALNGVVAQDTGHLVRSAIRRLKGAIDKHHLFGAQERIRIEILLRTNL